MTKKLNKRKTIYVEDRFIFLENIKEANENIPASHSKRTLKICLREISSISRWNRKKKN